MTDEKVYTPTEIEDQQLPNTVEPAILSVSGSTANDSYTPKTIKDTPLPRKVIAHETIASSFNTMSKKILGVYEFLQQGAIQIGKFVLGVSGDVRISPSGIVARDSSGNTSFALDGETGNATFRGSVQSGSLITGDVSIESGGQVSIGGDAILDEYGIVSSSIANTSETSATGLNQHISSTIPTYTDFTGSSISFTLPRDTMMMFIGNINYWVTRNSGSGSFGAAIYIDIFLDDAQIGAYGDIANQAAYYNGTTFNTDGPLDSSTHSTLFSVRSVAAGTHTIKLKGSITSTVGDPTLNIYGFNLTYVKLGT